MPISGALLATLIQAQMTANGMAGQYDLQLSQAVGNGIINTILTSAIYTGTSTGLGIGAGTSTGTLSGSIIIGPAVSGLIFAQMTAAGLAGQYSLPLANSIGSAVATHMATAIVMGASTVVGIGTGTGTIVGVLGPSMGALILLQMTAMGLNGAITPQLANSIGSGVASAIQASIATTTIVGVAVGTVPPAFPPIPSVGVDTGKIV
jgi:hypothetical protein